MVPAHVTLFHALPGAPDDEAAACEALDAIAAPGAFPLEVTGVRFLGRGVAYTFASPSLESRRASVAERFRGRLTAQDSQRFQPHVTVQNKADPGEARRLHRTLAAEFVPGSVDAGAFHLWRYLGGPWEPIRTARLS